MERKHAPFLSQKRHSERNQAWVSFKFDFSLSLSRSIIYLKKKIYQRYERKFDLFFRISVACDLFLTIFGSDCFHLIFNSILVASIEALGFFLRSSFLQLWRIQMEKTVRYFGLFPRSRMRLDVLEIEKGFFGRRSKFT